MAGIKEVVRDNFIFLLIALLPYAGLPAIVYAQQGGMPEVFTEPLSVLRGKIIPQSDTAEIWPEEYYCEIVKRDWGWSSCGDLEAFIVGFNNSVDTLLVEKPNSGGFVKFDDWDPSDLEEEVTAIEKELKLGVKAQSEAVGIPIKFERWRAYPTLNKEMGVMYYATDISFDGEISTNIKASVFDRYGYNVFRIVPFRSDLSEQEISQIVDKVAVAYQPNQTARREAFTSGDKVAAVGAIGVLATLVGVKYGKAAATGALAIAMLILKKAWFVLLLPFYWLLNIFRRKRS